MTTLAHLLKNTAQAFPDNQAVFYEGQALDYAHLDDLSDRLAQGLCDLGVQADDRVGLWMPKSLCAVIAIFAILKAGAAYVPISELAPPNRVGFVAGDCNMKVLLTDHDGVDRLGDASVAGAVPVAVDMAMLEALVGRMERPAAEPSRLAYLFYTSGSTGVPKGVMVTHDAALNFVNWASTRFGIGPDDRLASLAPLSFDLSVLDIFAAVHTGACVHMISSARMIFPTSLSRYIQEHAITIWYSVPAVLARLASHGRLDKHSMASLRHVLFAGETFPVAQLETLMQAVPDARFHNLYGPTETNVVSHFEIDRLEGDAIPIGRPCAGNIFAIIAEDGTVATGAATGELLVSGPSLMQGYCNLPDLTQARLVPLARTGNALAYRTGDRVRRDDNGVYHFLGRLDDMIKSRGVRIEPGEIESVLLRQPSVEEAIVLGRPDPDIGHRLVAIVVLEDVVPDTELITYCRDFLPTYMVPSEFLQSSTGLPRTATGKIDRLAARALLEGIPA